MTEEEFINNIQVSKEEFLDAVENGMKRAILVSFEDKCYGNIGSYLLQAITDGVREAIWNLATNATSRPCHDFYETIKEGVKEAIKECHE